MHNFKRPLQTLTQNCLKEWALPYAPRFGGDSGISPHRRRDESAKELCESFTRRIVTNNVARGSLLMTWRLPLSDTAAAAAMAATQRKINTKSSDDISALDVRKLQGFGFNTSIKKSSKNPKNFMPTDPPSFSSSPSTSHGAKQTKNWKSQGKGKKFFFSVHWIFYKYCFHSLAYQSNTLIFWPFWTLIFWGSVLLVATTIALFCFLFFILVKVLFL